MKVLYLINFAGKAGTEKYVENLVDYLHPDRCECSLGYNVDGPLAEKMRAKGIETFQIEMNSPFDTKAAKKLARICKDNNIDVVHAQYPRENYIAIRSKKYGNTAKIVFTSHLTIYQPLAWKFFNRIYTRKNHCIISVCNEGRDILIQNKVCPEKIKVVFNGIDASKMPPHDRSPLSEFGIGDEKVISILTRFSPEKGLLFLCDALKLLKEKTDVPFRVLIVGDGAQFDEIKQRVSEYELDKNVILTGFRTDTSYLLAASDIYLNTSSSNEAMSFAILEALANALPVVATEVGGNRDLVELGGECGYVVDFGDTEGFANAVKTLLEDDGKRLEFSRSAREKAESVFDMNNLLEDVYKAYS